MIAKTLLAMLGLAAVANAEILNLDMKKSGSGSRGLKTWQTFNEGNFWAMHLEVEQIVTEDNAETAVEVIVTNGSGPYLFQRYVTNLAQARNIEFTSGLLPSGFYTVSLRCFNKECPIVRIKLNRVDCNINCPEGQRWHYCTPQIGDPQSCNDTCGNVPAGNYCTGLTGYIGPSEKICPQGSYCKNGQRKSCPPGYSSREGSDDLSDCEPSVPSGMAENKAEGDEGVPLPAIIGGASAGAVLIFAAIGMAVRNRNRNSAPATSSAVENTL